MLDTCTSRTVLAFPGGWVHQIILRYLNRALLTVCLNCVSSKDGEKCLHDHTRHVTSLLTLYPGMHKRICVLDNLPESPALRTPPQSQFVLWLCLIPPVSGLSKSRCLQALFAGLSGHVDAPSKPLRNGTGASRSITDGIRRAWYTRGVFSGPCTNSCCVQVNRNHSNRVTAAATTPQMEYPRHTESFFSIRRDVITSI